MSDGGARPTRPAGFWIRLVAALVDGVVVSLAQWSMTFVAARVWGREIDGSPGFQGLLGAFTLLFACVYSTVAHAATGQTIGKVLVGVRVSAVDGAPLAVGAALLRWFALFLSALPLGLGFVMAGLRTDKRALHDLIAGSRVQWVAPVRVEPHEPAPSPALGSDPVASPLTAAPWPRGGPGAAPSPEAPPPPAAPPTGA
ncbi:MAG TPA: RDD family protein [Methylomirabilota bacterium]|nr:RDD family protein [Methylomirabilota bacterium]